MSLEAVLATVESIELAVSQVVFAWKGEEEAEGGGAFFLLIGFVFFTLLFLALLFVGLFQLDCDLFSIFFGSKQSFEEEVGGCGERLKGLVV